MPLLVVQRGHVPRTTGATGTAGEQATVTAIAAEIQRLKPADWSLRVINADEPYNSYRGDAFIALHCDGGAPGSRGASVGYKTAEGNALAQRWKAAYAAQGFPGGWRNDNYTTNLSGYYGFSRCLDVGNRACIVVEHGFLTNSQDKAWIQANITKCAAAVWTAVAGANASEGADDLVKVITGAPGRVWRLSKGELHRWRNSEAGINSAIAGGYGFEDAAFDLHGDIPVHSFSSPNGAPILTTDAGEAAALRAARWSYDGVIGGAGKSGVPIYRLARGENHLHTASMSERNALLATGQWKDEGIGFYCGVPAVQREVVEVVTEVPAAIPAQYMKAYDFYNDALALVADYQD